MMRGYNTLSEMVDKEIHEVRIYTKGLDFQGKPTMTDHYLMVLLMVNQKHMKTSLKRL